jgi:hypothetical protein
MVYFCQNTQRYIPEICNLHTRSHENLKSHKIKGSFILRHFKVENRWTDFAVPVLRYL